ncbi:MAG TPA: anthranilate/aminodeoxychorismate synthase component II [Candidatus Jacksonbacteria bacterium]|nr:MAG: anthranilate/aminodeoxychorismate synthase component II [Gammaproteobacteria bacterium RIFOXYB2_FULL_38_6]HBH46964.1 anthranilate/aminodeoxychorismate synthase component II [Candidatus Jacksonbacteria bacterium]
MKILILDNFDSFTYNLYQYVGEIMQSGNDERSLHSPLSFPRKRESMQIIVKRNNEITVSDIKRAKYDRIIISPGPGSPDNPKYFGICGEVLTVIGRETPVLGVCLGMQGLAHYYGGHVIRAKLPMHGKTSLIEHDGQGIFCGLPKPLEVMRYHSLVVDPKSLPKCLEVTAWTLENDATSLSSRAQSRDPSSEIMGLRHRDFPIQGIQFHPESFATEGGREILKNFLTTKKTALILS